MRKVLTLLLLLLCMTLLFAACDKSSKSTDSDKKASEEEENIDSEDKSENEAGEDDKNDYENSEEIEEDTKEVNSSNIQTIADFSEYWSGLYEGNEAVINSYEGMPIMELLYPGICFITGVQYDLLNIDNTNGNFEGDLLLAGYQAYLEKDGSKLIFGYEDVLEEDGFSPTMLAGDKNVEKGNCDLADGYYYSEEYTERDGVIISRTVSELKIEDDGGISAFVLDGDLYNFRNEEDLSNTFTFVRNGKNQYDFVVAKAEIGTDFNILSLEDNMTKEKAATMFEDAGFVVETSGGIVDGVFTLD